MPPPSKGDVEKSIFKKGDMHCNNLVLKVCRLGFVLVTSKWLHPGRGGPNPIPQVSISLKPVTFSDASSSSIFRYESTWKTCPVPFFGNRIDGFGGVQVDGEKNSNSFSTHGNSAKLRSLWQDDKMLRTFGWVTSLKTPPINSSSIMLIPTQHSDFVEGQTEESMFTNLYLYFPWNYRGSISLPKRLPKFGWGLLKKLDLGGVWIPTLRFKPRFVVQNVIMWHTWAQKNFMH